MIFTFLLITSFAFDTVMVYTLGGQLVHELGGSGPDPGRLDGPYGICVEDSGAVYVTVYLTDVCRFSDLFHC